MKYQFVGERFGRLVIAEQLSGRENSTAGRYRAVCDCGLERVEAGAMFVRTIHPVKMCRTCAQNKLKTHRLRLSRPITYTPPPQIYIRRGSVKFGEGRG